MIAVIVVALGIGLWPVHVNVFGDASYSCGSGFLHSAHTWNVDSTSLEFQRISSDESATLLPASACPDKVGNRRDLALLLMAFSLAIGLIAQLMLDRPGQPNFGSTLFSNRRRGRVRPSLPVRRAPPEESGAQ
jgi:hypothetical protein